MNELNLSWAWLSLALLGAFHGLNPAMGWLFAVALGFQEKRLRAVLTALGPIALGHALAIGVVAVAVGLLGLVLPSRLVLILGGLALLAFAAYKVATRFRHPRWVGMHVRSYELVSWSFLMATAHGAGLMLVPVLARLRLDAVSTALAAPNHAHHAQGLPTDHALLPTLIAVGLHTAAMFAVMATIASVVYRHLGVQILRRAWINLDLIWLAALALAGVFSLATAILPAI